VVPRWLERITGSQAGDAVPSAPAPGGEPDSVAALRGHVTALVARVDAEADVLPTEAVVVARRITDLADEALRRAEGPDTPGMNIHGRVALHAVLTDYVPTSLRRHAAARTSALVGAPAGPGAAPGTDPEVERLEAELVEQLGAILGAVQESVDALRDDDVRAVEAQGIFLRTRFAGSDL